MAQSSASPKRKSPSSGNRSVKQTQSATKRKKTTVKNTPKKKSVEVQSKKNSPFADEIILMVTTVISILLILSNLNLGGTVSDYVNDVMYGLMGWMAKFFPFFLFFGMVFWVANRKNIVAKHKLYSIFGMMYLVIALLQLMTYPTLHMSDLVNSYLISSVERQGGGFLGGILVIPLVTMVGEIGTYVVLIGIFIVLFMFASEWMLFTTLQERGKEYSKMRSERPVKQPQETSREKVKQTGTYPKRTAKTFTFEREAVDIVAQEEILSELEEVESLFEQERRELDFPIQRANPLHASNEVPFETTTSLFESSKEEESLEPENLEHLEHENVEQEPVIYIEREQEVSYDEPMVPEETMYQKKDPNMKEVHNSEFKKSKISQAEEALQAIAINKEINQNAELIKKYEFPSVDLLSKPKGSAKGMSDRELKETALKLQSTLDSFGVRVTITNVSCGPSVTRYELQPEQGVKVSKITNLADDIKLNLAAADIRIEAPIPGKAAVGIEVPNKVNSMVAFRELVEGDDFKGHTSDIAFAVGKDIGGQTVVTDIARMPHLLIAGATGSGKSVCINTLIMSILYKASPEDVKLIMIDPKVVELSVYNGIPHLLIPVVTDPKKASAALHWAVTEMTERYKKFAELGVRDIKGFNKKIQTLEQDSEQPTYQKLPQIVIIVDELADLMMVAPGEVEDAICRLAQMARAAGLHLIIATQRPSVNVITGLIKANVPSRIAFSVSSAIDSRTIIDGAGAEKLLGKGDMLFFPSGYPKPVRIQGAFISDKEVSEVVEFLSKQNGHGTRNEELEGKITSGSTSSVEKTSEVDDYFVDAGKFIIDKDKASIGMLQRVFKVGFNRAARIMQQLCDAGVVSPEEGTKPRKVLMSMDEFEEYIEETV